MVEKVGNKWSLDTPPTSKRSRVQLFLQGSKLRGIAVVICDCRTFALTSLSRGTIGLLKGIKYCIVMFKGKVSRECRVIPGVLDGCFQFGDAVRIQCSE